MIISSKKYIFTFLVLVTSLSMCKGNYAVKDTMNVLSINGLNIRQEASLTCSIIGNLKYGNEVIVVNTYNFKKTDTIDNRMGNWIQISFNDLEGFVFDGYLSGLPVPELDIDRRHPYERLNEYIRENFTPIQEPIRITEPYIDVDGKDANSSVVTKMSNNLTRKETYWYEEWEDKLYFEKIRFSELISLFEIFINGNNNYIKAYQGKINSLNSSNEIGVIDFILSNGITSKAISFSEG